MSIIANLFEDPRNDPVAAFLLQVFITLILSKIFTKLLSFIHQPAVIGQIVAGIVLGPSAIVSSMGLIFFMFYLGLKMDPNEIRQGWQRTLPVALISIAVPVSIGCVISLWLYSMVPPNVNKASFILFVGSGIGFSAFPVLAAILQSLNLIKTPLGEYNNARFEQYFILVWFLAYP
ncbi:unnamed protein product [Rotaria magnacalcarata]|uniref:Cation/H+ exchanger transmembrane domain-containing protein n=1 Tax=Rotaria magnacalcarata TaxID=392030 RepID=A0A8S2JL88_9BILA|nr:unnamed protein product [Rotaria magnacalcarata]